MRNKMRNPHKNVWLTGTVRSSHRETRQLFERRTVIYKVVADLPKLVVPVSSSDRERTLGNQYLATPGVRGQLNM